MFGCGDVFCYRVFIYLFVIAVVVLLLLYPPIAHTEQ